MEKLNAAVLVIGDEILSGRTEDANINPIARTLAGLGIDLEEVRIVPDDEGRIIEAVNALRKRYTYVFTTGGIGPTHDDITAEAIAKAFDVPIEENPEALSLLSAHYTYPKELNEARRRMARIPKGGSLIKNPLSGAPGFQIGNVFVFAGVPSIMRAMLEEVAPRLKTGTPVKSCAIASHLPEGAFALQLGEIQKRHSTVSIGSYPSFEAGKPESALVVRGREPGEVEAAAQEIEAMLQLLGDHPEKLE